MSCHRCTYECYYCSRQRDQYGFWHFVLDLLLICITCGLWGLYLIFRALRRK